MVVGIWGELRVGFRGGCGVLVLRRDGIELGEAKALGRRGGSVGGEVVGGYAGGCVGRRMSGTSSDRCGGGCVVGRRSVEGRGARNLRFRMPLVRGSGVDGRRAREAGPEGFRDVEVPSQQLHGCAPVWRAPVQLFKSINAGVGEALGGGRDGRQG